MVAAPAWATTTPAGLPSGVSPDSPDVALSADLSRHHPQLAARLAALRSAKATGNPRAARRAAAALARTAETLLTTSARPSELRELLWVAAKSWRQAGQGCDGRRDADGDLRIGPDGELLPWPAHRLPALKRACAHDMRAAWHLTGLRDWKVAPGAPEAQARTVESDTAGLWLTRVLERAIVARAALPVGDPDRLPTRLVPELPPDVRQDVGDARANERSDHIVRVRRKTIDPALVTWLAAADAYLTRDSKHPRRAERVRALALKAGQVLHRNRHFDPWQGGPDGGHPPEFWSSRVRFMWLMKRHPSSEQAIEAAKASLDSYAIEPDVVGRRKVVRMVESLGIGTYNCPTPIREVTSVPWVCPPGSLCFKSRSADRLFVDATQAEERAKAIKDPERAFAAHKEADLALGRAADAYRALLPEARTTKEKLAFLMNAHLLYARIGRHRDVYAVLGEAEAMLRGVAVAPADIAERRRNQRRLVQVLKRRAAYDFDLMRISDSIEGYQRVFAIDPDGEGGENALLNAANLAFSNHQWQRSVTLNQQVEARFGGARLARHQEVVSQARWRVGVAHKNLGDDRAWFRALRRFLKLGRGTGIASDRMWQARLAVAEIHRRARSKREERRAYKHILRTFRKASAEDEAMPDARRAVAVAKFRLQEARHRRLRTAAALSRALKQGESWGVPADQLLPLRVALSRRDPLRHPLAKAPVTLPAPALSIPAPGPVAPPAAGPTRELELQALSHLNAGRYAAARPLLARASAQNSPTAAYQLGLLAMREGKLREARRHLGLALARQPTMSLAVVLLAAVHLQGGDPKGAIEAVDKALARRPGDVMLLCAKGACLAAVGQHAAALTVLRAALEIDTDNPEILRNIGAVYIDAKREGLGLLALNKGYTGYASAKPAQTGRPRGPKADSSFLQSYDTRCAQGSDGLVGCGAESLSRAQGLAHIYFVFGQLAQGKGGHKEAATHMRKAVAFRPRYAEAWNDLGLALLAEGKAEEAIVALQTALKWRPGMMQAHLNLGSAWAASARGGRIVEAARHFRAAMKRAPTHAVPTLNLAILLVTHPALEPDEVKRYDRAIALYQQAQQAVLGREAISKLPIVEYLREASSAGASARRNATRVQGGRKK